MWDRKMVESTIGVFESEEKRRKHLEEFFINRKVEPANEEEKKTIEEFNMITSAMSLMIHIAQIDDTFSTEEQDEIIEQMFFQLKQRFGDYKKLAEEYGKDEKYIVQRVFDELMAKYRKDELDIDEVIENINLVFANNEYARHFVLRLLYYTAFADNCLKSVEIDAIEEISSKLSIEPENLARIRDEVLAELRIDLDGVCEAE